jgi:hypothetical protein
VLVYERRHGMETFVIALNFSTEVRRLPVSSNFPVVLSTRDDATVLDGLSANEGVILRSAA